MVESIKRHKNNAIYHQADDLGGLEYLCADYIDQRFSRHVHEGTCIGVIESGAQHFFGSGEYHLAPRDSIILVNADQIHDGHRATAGGWSYRAMYPEPEMLAKVSPELSGRIDDVPWFPEHVVFDSELASRLRGLFDILQCSDQLLERETVYLDTMTHLIQRHGRGRSSLNEIGKAPKSVALVREYLDENSCENVSLEALAQLVDLSPYYLVRLFQKYVGLPPHAYQVQRRLLKAKQLIYSGVGLASTALECGFSDQSHLNRQFKRYLGITPGVYQKHNSSNL